MSTTCSCETAELEKSGLIVVQPKASASTWAIDLPSRSPVHPSTSIRALSFLRSPAPLA
jgi:hypothetical protein